MLWTGELTRVTKAESPLRTRARAPCTLGPDFSAPSVQQSHPEAEEWRESPPGNDTGNEDAIGGNVNKYIVLPNGYSGQPKKGHLTFDACFESEKVQSDLLHKYQSTGDILILTVRLAVIVAVILTVPVLFFTVRSSLFELAKKTKFHLCRHVLVTIILLIIINLLVIFIPSMKDIFGVVGVTSANMLIFILPSSLYLKITNQDGDKGTQRIWAALFLGLGVLFSLISIPLVIYDWACSSGTDEGH